MGELASAFGHGARRVGPPPPTGEKLASLRAVAARVAALNGDPRPSSAIAVPATRKSAEAVKSGADVNTDQDSNRIVPRNVARELLDRPGSRRDRTLAMFGV